MKNNVQFLETELKKEDYNLKLLNKLKQSLTNYLIKKYLYDNNELDRFKLNFEINPKRNDNRIDIYKKGWKDPIGYIEIEYKDNNILYTFVVRDILTKERVFSMKTFKSYKTLVKRLDLYKKYLKENIEWSSYEKCNQ